MEAARNFAYSIFSIPRELYFMDRLASSNTETWQFVSPRYRLRNIFSERANTFQSTWRRSSPGEYIRYSANSWLNPKSGERCKPEMKPSTTVLAIRSRLDIPASTDGSRNLCRLIVSNFRDAEVSTIP